MNRVAIITAVVGALAGASALVAPGVSAQDAEKPYTVMDGNKVDKGTYNGYRRYDNACLRCHGPDGAGSSYAPALVDSLKRMSQEDFNNTVINGRQNVSTAQQNVMPAFGNNEDVATYIDDIYSYLKARSDGALSRGRPERLPADKDPKANS